LNAIQKRSAPMAKFSAWFRSFPPFSDVYGAGESGAWRERVAEANCSAVRDGRDTCESAVGRPILCRRRQPGPRRPCGLHRGHGSGEIDGPVGRGRALTGQAAGDPRWRVTPSL
jgi:hypothetical protein